MAPSNEVERLKALRDLAVLDTAAEESFDELTRAAALACDMPIALISLIDAERQWFKAKIGIDASQTPREIAFCAHAILTPEEVLVVPDAVRDARFADNPLVTGEPSIRSYAGAPLVDAAGHALGTLCVIDRRPHDLQPRQREVLSLLARQVVRLLEARAAASRLAMPTRARSVEPLRTLIEEVPTGAVLVGEDGRLEVNHEACAIINYRPEQVPDVDAWFMLLYGEAQGAARRLYEQDRLAGFPDPRVIWIQCGDGRRRQIEFNAVRSPRGEMWLLRDVTASVGAEERFRVLFEQSSDAHLLCDEHGIIDCNRATVTMFRYQDKRQVLGTHPATLSPELQPGGRRSDELGREMQRLAHERGHHRFEWVHRRVDGSDFDVEVSLTPVMLSGRSVTLAVLHDISERKVLEGQLRDSIARAEAATRAKSDFLATMSHELRTPMNGVIGMTSLLLDTPLNEQQREFATTVRTCGDQLLALINDILDFSKIEAGHLVLEQIPFSPRKLAEDVVGLLAEQAEQKRLQLVSLIDGGVPTKLLGDPTRLRQVLLNLLGNAVKFTERGEVVLSLSVVALDERTVTLDLAIRDTGIGISAAARDRLFRPFSQADSSTTRKYGGTGLGLVICQRLIQVMGGTITLESESGKGSTFTCRVTLPVAAEAPAEPHHAGLIGRQVLVVAASPTMRRSLREHCIAWGMGCVESSDLAEALAAGAVSRPALVVIDHDLPGGGLALAPSLRQQLAGVPLVLLAGGSHRGMATAAREAGFAGFLTKPVRHVQLFDCLLVVLNQAVRPTPAPVLVTRHSLAEERERRRVLVVEDNPVNRQVAVMMLNKLGCRCDIATNGREAVAAVMAQDYHLVFMDCQMPEMDGFAAASEIRRRENGTRHTRIVALTANAMSGDRERCLAAGMDDYVSKPIQSADLEAALRRNTPAAPAIAVSARAAAGTVVVDAQVLAGLIDSTDHETVRAVVEMLKSEAPQALAELRTAVANGDAVAVARTAHRLKGSSGTLGLKEVQALCQTLEQSGRAKHLAEVGHELAALEQALAHALPVLAAHPLLT